MAKKPTKLSRSALPTQSREAAGNTPVASPAPDAPATLKAAGEHLPTDVVAWPEQTTGSVAAAEARQEANELTESERASSLSDGLKIIESGSKEPETQAAVKPQPVKENTVATPQRTSGAGWFIPPQRPSQFGVK